MKKFDYVYYRAYCWYKGKKELNYHIMGIVIVTLLIAMFLLSVLTILTLFSFPIPEIEKWHSAIFLVIIFSLMWYRYNKLINYEELHKKWEKENKKVKYRRGLLIIAVLISFIFFPILIGYLRHNLGLNI